MTINIATPKRLRIYEEPNGSFATDHSGTLGDYLDCPFIEGSWESTLEHPTESPAHSQQHLDGYPLEVLMPKFGKAKFKLGMETTGTRAAAGVTALQGALGRLLKIGMGTETLGVGTTVASTSTSTVINCTSAAGIAVGSAIGCATGIGGLIEYREVASKSSNAITLKHALSGAPANSSVVYSSATYSLGGTTGSQTTSLQAIIEGYFASARWLYSGGWMDATPTFEFAYGQRPIVGFSWMFANWNLADGSATSANLVGAGALGFATYANNSTVVQADSEFRQQTVGTSTIGSLVQASSIAFDPQIKFSTQRSPAGVNTYVQPIRDRNAPVITGNFVVPYEDSTWYTARDSRTVKALWYQIGMTTALGGILVSAPTVQIKNVQPAIVDGIECQKVEWVGRLDEATSGSTTDLARSALRVHLF